MCFCACFKALGSFRSDQRDQTPWLARLTRNLLIDHYRRTRNERVTDSIEEQLPRAEVHTGAGVSAPMRPDSAVAGREASELLQEALGKLSPELRETIILRDLQEMEYREIAEVLAIPEGTVKSRLKLGRKELARLLRRNKNGPPMSCADFEILLADWIDGTLAAPAREAERQAFVRHLESCAACAALQEDASSAVAFMERAAEVEMPAALVPKIPKATNSGWEFKLRGRKKVSGWINRTFAPVLRPRVVMGEWC